MNQTNFQLISVLALCFAVTFTGCAETPSSGLLGEYCVDTLDCSENLTCYRQVCVASAEESQVAERDSLWFAGLRIENYIGQGEQQLLEFAGFIADLSSALYPYYAIEAHSESQLDFGVTNSGTDPVTISTNNTITSMTLGQDGNRQVASSENLLIPVIFSNNGVILDFDLPLTNAMIILDFGETGDGPGAGELTGSLRAVDGENIFITSGEQTFSVFDLLRAEDLTVDTDGDGVEDAWELAWTITAEHM